MIKLRNCIISLSAFVPNLLVCDDLYAQPIAQDTINVSAKVVDPLGIKQLAKINFGEFRVTASGFYGLKCAAPPSPNGATVISPPTKGSFRVSAPAGLTVNISIPTYATRDVTLAHAGGGAPSKELVMQRMWIADISGVFTPINEPTAFNGNPVITKFKVSNAGGTATFCIGGRLEFRADQYTGLYTGTYLLRVTF